MNALPRLGSGVPAASLVVLVLLAVDAHGRCPHPLGLVLLPPVNIASRPTCPVCWCA